MQLALNPDISFLSVYKEIFLGDVVREKGRESDPDR